MIFTYSEMLSVQNEIKSALEGNLFRRVEEVGEKTWVFYFEAEEGIKKLLVSTNYPFCRFHLTKNRYHKAHSPFADRLTHVLEGKRLKSIALLNSDRILGLEFDEGVLIAEMMHKHPKVVLVDKNKNILISEHPLLFASYAFPLKKKEHELDASVLCTSDEIEKKFNEAKQIYDIQELKKKYLDKAIQMAKKMDARIRVHTLDLDEAEHYPEKEHEAHLLQANYHLLKRGLKEIQVEDWEKEGTPIQISLDPALLPEEQLKLRFKHVRKMKKRLIICPELINDLEKEKDKIVQLKEMIHSAQSLQELRSLSATLKIDSVKQPRPKEKNEKKFFRDFTTESGFKILVGKKDKDNDRLTFSIAKGNDLWLHAANFPGSHVVLQLKQNKVDETSLMDAMQLALHFSKAKGKGAQEVVFTECKFLAKPKGAAFGKVVMSKHKKRIVTPDDAILKRLLGNFFS